MLLVEIQKLNLWCSILFRNLVYSLLLQDLELEHASVKLNLELNLEHEFVELKQELEQVVILLLVMV